MKVKPTIAFFFSVCLICISGLLNAQSLSLGVKGGLINSEFVSDLKTSSRNDLYFGLTANRRINATYSVQVELNYLRYGSIENGLQPVPAFAYSRFNIMSERIYYANYKKETILSSIQIPVLAKVQLPISMRLKYYILLGPYISILTKAKSKSSGSSVIYEDIDGKTPALLGSGSKEDIISFNDAQTEADKFRNANMGFEGGLGFNYGKACSRTRFFIEGRFAMSVSNLQKASSPVSKLQDLKIIAVGYLYKL